MRRGVAVVAGVVAVGTALIVQVPVTLPRPVVSVSTQTIRPVTSDSVEVVTQFTTPCTVLRSCPSAVVLTTTVRDSALQMTTDSGSIAYRLPRTRDTVRIAIPACPRVSQVQSRVTMVRDTGNVVAEMSPTGASAWLRIRCRPPTRIELAMQDSFPAYGQRLVFCQAWFRKRDPAVAGPDSLPVAVFGWGPTDTLPTLPIGYAIPMGALRKNRYTGAVEQERFTVADPDCTAQIAAYTASPYGRTP